jgi:MSHA biogenesis protein MshM
MIRSYFGIEKNPFSSDDVTLLPYQQEVYDILEVHSTQGGLCLLMGEPGTGKTAIKEEIRKKASKRMSVISVARTLHTYTNTIKILCQAFNINFVGTHFSCEKRLIEEAFNLKRGGNRLILIIDDAHLMEMQTLRRIRLLLEDFPKNYNLILAGQPALLHSMCLKVNDDIKSRVTFSVVLKRLAPDDMKSFISSQLDLAGLGHNTFTEEAIDLITRSADGILRRTRNLCLGSFLEAVRVQRKTIDIDLVNRVLIQPHWRNEYDMQHIG